MFGLLSITIPPQEPSPSPFGMSVLARRQKRPPPRAGAWDLLIKPGSLGVRSASVGQAWMSIVSDLFAAGVVVLAAVGQLDTSFGRGCWSFVGVTSVEKSSHD